MKHPPGAPGRLKTKLCPYPTILVYPYADTDWIHQCDLCLGTGELADYGPCDLCDGCGWLPGKATTTDQLRADVTVMRLKEDTK